jgi:hypothetical protein
VFLRLTAQQKLSPLRETKRLRVQYIRPKRQFAKHLSKKMTAIEATANIWLASFDIDLYLILIFLRDFPQKLHRLFTSCY